MMDQATFQSVNIGKVRLKNRLMVSSMGGHFVEFYEAVARGGYGLIMVQNAVFPDKKLPAAIMTMPNDDFIEPMSRISTVIKKYDAVPFIQLNHIGRQGSSRATGMQPVAASPVPSAFVRETPREMETGEVYDMVETFVQSAVRAKTAGFMGVELCASHGYLLHNFLSARANKRIDEFGGGYKGRTYIIKLIIEGIKRECGADFPVMVRFGCMEGGEGGYKENEGAVYARLFESYGADAVDVSAGTYDAEELISGTPYAEPAVYLKYTRQIKEAVSIPVVAVNRYTSPEMVEYVLASGGADVVSMARQAITDPDFPNKMKENEGEDIIPCIGCLTRCNPFFLAKYAENGDIGMSCAFNPLGTNRKQLQFAKTDQPKKVVIAGAGPAGLETAWIAAARGHDVTVYEKNQKSKAGGTLLTAAYPPNKHPLTQTIRHYVKECERYSVNLVFDKEIDEEFIRANQPDVLIVATGSVPVTPPIPGSDKIRVVQADDVLTGTNVMGNVLIVGFGQVGIETAEYCLDFCQKITLIDQLPQFGMGIDPGVLNDMNRNFRESGKVQIVPNTKVIEFTEDGAVCECGGETVTYSGYQTIILAAGRKALQPFADVEELAPEVYIIGDAKEARSASEAFFEGANIAINI